MSLDATSNGSFEPNLYGTWDDSTYKNGKKTNIWIFILHCLMKRDGFDRMFPFKKRDISEWDSGYEPKIINWGSW